MYICPSYSLLEEGKLPFSKMSIAAVCVCMHVIVCAFIRAERIVGGSVCDYVQKKARLESIHRALQDRKDLSPITRNPYSLFFFFSCIHVCYLLQNSFIRDMKETHLDGKNGYLFNCTHNMYDY